MRVRPVVPTFLRRSIATQRSYSSIPNSKVEYDRELLDREKLVLYDGECPMCSNVVRSVINFDGKKKFSFASIHSIKGKGLLERFGFGNEEGMKQFVLLEKEKPTSDPSCPPPIASYNATTAALRICENLENPIPLLGVFRFVPESLRNGIVGLAVKTGLAAKILKITAGGDYPSDQIRDRFIDKAPHQECP